MLVAFGLTVLSLIHYSTTSQDIFFSFNNLTSNSVMQNRRPTPLYDYSALSQYVEYLGRMMAKTYAEGSKKSIQEYMEAYENFKQSTDNPDSMEEDEKEKDGRRKNKKMNTRSGKGKNELTPKENVVKILNLKNWAKL
ncbi:hypothetical protein B5X24_HaOG215847 [Helicoverpa armigera]|nr:hypothetical protein B5X24_HaOG215847 [Helicoverpa armigera]